MASKTVLVIDDDQTMRDLATEVLADEGYLAVAAPDTGVGIAELGRRPVDLILLNPGTFALADEAFVQAAHGTAGRRVPVLLWTGWPKPAERAAALGADGALPKPTDLNVLLELVRREVGVP